MGRLPRPDQNGNSETMLVPTNQTISTVWPLHQITDKCSNKVLQYACKWSHDMLDPLGPCAESVRFKPMADGKPSALAMVLVLCADSCAKLSGCIICKAQSCLHTASGGSFLSAGLGLLGKLYAWCMVASNLRRTYKCTRGSRGGGSAVG